MKLHYRLFAVFLALTISSFAQTAKKSIIIGDKAPDFHLPDLKGKPYLIEDFKKADILVVIFMNKSCPSMKHYQDRLKNLFHDYKQKDIFFVIISTHWKHDLLHHSYDHHDPNANYLWLYDTKDMQAANAFGPEVMPYVYVFNSSRKLFYKGAIDDSENPHHVKNNYLAEALNQSLNKLPVCTSQTMAFGCEVTHYVAPLHVASKKSAHDFSLKELSVDSIKLLVKNHTDEFILLNFWSTKCKLCRLKLKELVFATELLENEHVSLVSFNIDGIKNINKAGRFLQSCNHKGQHYVMEDENLKHLKLAGIPEDEEIPHILLIAPGGEVIYTSSEEIAREDLLKNVYEYTSLYKPGMNAHASRTLETR